MLKCVGMTFYSFTTPSPDLTSRKGQTGNNWSLPGLFFFLNCQEKFRACSHLSLFDHLVKKKIGANLEIFIFYCCKTKSLSF